MSHDLPNIIQIAVQEHAGPKALDPEKFYRASTWGLWDRTETPEDPFAVGTVAWAENRDKGWFFGLRPSLQPGHPSAVRCIVVAREPDYVIFQLHEDHDSVPR